MTPRKVPVESSRPRTESEVGGTGEAPSPSAPPDLLAGEREVRAERARERAGASTDRVRRHRDRKRKAEQDEIDAESFETEARECGAVFAVVYDLALVPLVKGRLRPLESDQAARAGRALVPLVRKYAPMLGEYQSEVAAVLVLAAIFRENWQSPAVEVPLEDVADATPEA